MTCKQEGNRSRQVQADSLGSSVDHVTRAGEQNSCESAVYYAYCTVSSCRGRNRRKNTIKAKRHFYGFHKLLNVLLLILPCLASTLYSYTRNELSYHVIQCDYLTQ